MYCLPTDSPLQSAITNSYLTSELRTYDTSIDLVALVHYLFARYSEHVSLLFLNLPPALSKSDCLVHVLTCRLLVNTLLFIKHSYLWE